MSLVWCDIYWSLDLVVQYDLPEGIAESLQQHCSFVQRFLMQHPVQGAKGMLRLQSAVLKSM